MQAQTKAKILKNKGLKVKKKGKSILTGHKEGEKE